MGPLLTSAVWDRLLIGRRGSTGSVACSLDLQRTTSLVEVGPEHWTWNGERFSYPERCRPRTIYHWVGGFEPAARYAESLVKLVPTHWGPPTFEIDGIKMLPTAKVSPYADAERKVSLIQPRGKIVLDTCGGLGYFAACCLAGGAAQVISYEKNPDVLWLRSLNPWSPPAAGRLMFTQGDVTAAVLALPDRSVEAVVHDPPRVGIAGELYSQAFYRQLARVLERKGKLFHYVGNPNRLTTGRDVPNEVAERLRRAGFSVSKNGDGILAAKV